MIAVLPPALTYSRLCMRRDVAESGRSVRHNKNFQQWNVDFHFYHIFLLPLKEMQKYVLLLLSTHAPALNARSGDTFSHSRRPHIFIAFKMNIMCWDARVNVRVLLLFGRINAKSMMRNRANVAYYTFPMVAATPAKMEAFKTIKMTRQWHTHYTYIMRHGWI